MYSNMVCTHRQSAAVIDLRSQLFLPNESKSRAVVRHCWLAPSLINKKFAGRTQKSFLRSMVYPETCYCLLHGFPRNLSHLRTSNQKNTKRNMYTNSWFSRKEMKTNQFNPNPPGTVYKLRATKLLEKIQNRW